MDPPPSDRWPPHLQPTQYLPSEIIIISIYLRKDTASSSYLTDVSAMTCLFFSLHQWLDEPPAQRRSNKCSSEQAPPRVLRRIKPVRESFCSKREKSLDRASLFVFSSPQITIIFSSFLVILPHWLCQLQWKGPLKLIRCFCFVLCFSILGFCLKHPGLVESVYRKVSKQPSMQKFIITVITSYSSIAAIVLGEDMVQNKHHRFVSRRWQVTLWHCLHHTRVLCCNHICEAWHPCCYKRNHSDC